MKIITLFEKYNKIVYTALIAVLMFIYALFGMYINLGYEKVEHVHIYVALATLFMCAAFMATKVKGKLFVAGVFALSFVLQLVADTYPKIQLLMLLCFVVSVLIARFKVLYLPAVVIVVAALIYPMVTGIAMSKMYVTSGFAFILIAVTEAIEKFWKKEKIKDNKNSHIILLWPVWIMFLILVYAAPYSNKPYEWKHVKALYQKVVENIEKLVRFIDSDEEDFVVGMSGFSDEAYVSGDIILSDSDMLWVSSDRRLTTNLYLKGIMMTEFDGRRWKDTNIVGISDSRIDTFESYYAMKKYDYENADSYVMGTTLKFEYKDFFTRFYFSPLKMLSLREMDRTGFYVQHYDESFLNKIKQDKSEYVVYYYMLNIPRSKIGDIINSSSPEDEELWLEVVSTYHEGDYSLDELYKYREGIKQAYLKPVALSDRMQAWVNEVTGGCISQYDRLSAIESALSNMTYTLTPGTIPDDVDSPEKFLDYFVLEKKEGYCTYFATALTLLAWSEGIPARFVQGFYCPIVGQFYDIIKGNRAHAWSEVYFDGYGWVTFEATPGYDIGFVEYTNDRAEDAGTGEEEQEDENPDEEESATGSQEEEEKLKEEKDNKVARTAQSGAVILIAFSLVILVTDRIIKKVIYHKKDVEGRYRWEVNRCFAILKKIGFTKAQGETLEEFDRRIKKELHQAGKTSPDFISDYESVIYGGKGVTEDMLEHVLTDKKLLLTMTGFFYQIKEIM